MAEEAVLPQAEEDYALHLQQQLAEKEAELQRAEGTIRRQQRQIQDIARLNWYHRVAVSMVLISILGGLVGFYTNNDSKKTVIVTAKITNVTERLLSQGIALTAQLNQSVSAINQIVLELDLSETSYLVKTVIVLYFQLENIDVDEYWNDILCSAKLSLECIMREEVDLKRSLVKEVMATVTNQLKKKDVEVTYVKLELKNKENEHKVELRRMNENIKTELEKMDREIKEKKEELRKKEKEIEDQKRELKEKEKENKAELKEKEKESKAELKNKDEERKTELKEKNIEKNEEIKSLKNQLAEREKSFLDMLTKELNKRNTEDNTQVAKNTRDILKLCVGVLGIKLCAGFSV